MVVEDGGEMVVDVTEVVDSEGSHQQIYFHQPMSSVTGGTSQTYTVVQGSLEKPQHIAASYVPSVGPTVQQITGFEMTY